MKLTRRLRPVFFVSAALVALLSSGISRAQELKPSPPRTLLELQERLRAHVNDPRFAAGMWGVKVVSLETGKILFEHEPQKLLSPASNSKLYTVALALERLGPDYQIKTSIYSKAKPGPDGTLSGDLNIYGRGDPTITSHLFSNDLKQALAPLVAVITNAGIKRISGDIVGDDTYFHGSPYGSGWAWEDLEAYYGAEISALSINDNTVQLEIKPGEEVSALCKFSISPESSFLIVSNQATTAEKGKKRNLEIHRWPGEGVIYISGQMPEGENMHKEEITVHDPPAFFAAQLKAALMQQGVQVIGKSRSVHWRDREPNSPGISNLVEVGSIRSLSMAEIAREVMKPSQNLYTDLLLAHVGENSRTPQTPSETSSESLGIAELNRFLQIAGVKRGDVQFEEGSGLSRNNLTTANATIQLLRYMSRQPVASVYSNALPIAGVDGTLRNRMKGTAAAGNVRAKTGSLRWANSLSGFVTTAAGDHLIFCVMLNRYHTSDPSHSARVELDLIPELLAAFTGKLTESEKQ